MFKTCSIQYSLYSRTLLTCFTFVYHCFSCPRCRLLRLTRQCDSEIGSAFLHQKCVRLSSMELALCTLFSRVLFLRCVRWLEMLCVVGIVKFQWLFLSLSHKVNPYSNKTANILSSVKVYTKHICRTYFATSVNMRSGIEISGKTDLQTDRRPDMTVVKRRRRRRAAGIKKEISPTFCRSDTQSVKAPKPVKT